MFEVFPFGDNDHNQQILAGFEALRRRGSLAFAYRYDGIAAFGMNTAGKGQFSAVYQIIVLRMPGIGDVVFDVNDSDIVFDHLYDGCLVYFKRSYCPAVHGARPKMRPLGLNYEARPTFLGASALYRTVVLSKHPVSMARGILRTLGLPRPYTYCPRTDRPAEIDPGAPPRILFLARTWDPAEFDPIYHPHLQAINATRAACVRQMRRTFGGAFTGGLLPSAHAARAYPDCLIGDDLRVDRRAFLRLVDRHAICVSTSGLHDSTGWKFAEFVAKGRAVVAERMRFAVPGPMAEGRNYLSYDSVEACLDACAALIADPSLRHAMMSANRGYYLGYVMPESIVRNALDVVWAGLGLRMPAADRPVPARTEPAASAPLHDPLPSHPSGAR